MIVSGMMLSTTHATHLLGFTQIAAWGVGARSLLQKDRAGDRVHNNTHTQTHLLSSMIVSGMMLSTTHATHLLGFTQFAAWGVGTDTTVDRVHNNTTHARTS